MGGRVHTGRVSTLEEVVIRITRDTLYGGKIRIMIQHIRYLRRCSAKARHPDIQLLKNMVVFKETNPWRRSQKQSSVLALECALPSALENLPSSSAAQALPSLPSTPSVEDFQHMDCKALAALVAQKFAGDDECSITAVRAADPEVTILDEDGDDDMFDCRGHDERGYETDCLMDDTFVTPDGKPVPPPLSVASVLESLGSQRPDDVAKDPAVAALFGLTGRPALPVKAARKRGKNKVAPSFAYYEAKRRRLPPSFANPAQSADGDGARDPVETTVGAVANAVVAPVPPADGDDARDPAETPVAAVANAAEDLPGDDARDLPGLYAADDHSKLADQLMDISMRNHPALVTAKTPVGAGADAAAVGSIPNAERTSARSLCGCSAFGINWSLFVEPPSEESREFISRLPCELWPQHHSGPKKGKKDGHVGDWSYTVRLACGSKLEVQIKHCKIRMEASCKGVGRFKVLKTRNMKVDFGDHDAIMAHIDLFLCDCPKVYCNVSR